MPVVIEEHLAVLESLDARDADEAVRRLEYHLHRIFKLIEQLPERYRQYVAD